jgi:hypothetical protein
MATYRLSIKSATSVHRKAMKINSLLYDRTLPKSDAKKGPETCP